MSIPSKLIRPLQREWIVFAATVGSPAFRELLLWCMPALIVGGIARAALNIHFPYGYFQPDTPDFLETAERLIRHHALVIHGKKAFLAPICFTVPFLVHVPAMIVIPIVQHLAGLGATVLAGGMVRCWFRFWRWFIIPFTLLYTLNPALLWYEQALMAESQSLICVTGLALAGTLLVRRPATRRFAWLIVLLFLTAGSRPEGKLFAAFGIGVTALAFHGDAKVWARRMGVMAVAVAGIWLSSRSTQAGLLLYATVLPLAPHGSPAAPGIEPYVEPLRQAALIQGQTVRTRLNLVERQSYDAIGAYLKSLGKPADEAHASALAEKLSLEAMRHNPQLLPAIAANKFLMTCRPDRAGGFEATSGGFTPYWIYGQQMEALERRDFVKPLMKGLTGRDLETDDEMLAFLHQEYLPLDPDWFSPLQRLWSSLTLGLQWNSHGADKRFVPGWPALWLLAGAGMLASLAAGDGLWRFHLPWLGALAGVWFAVMLTGVVNPRYRFLFEPFCILYALLLFDLLARALRALRAIRALKIVHFLEFINRRERKEHRE